MKIALVNNQYQLGGAETVVGQLKRGIAEAGHQVELHVAVGKTFPSEVHPFYPRALSWLHHTRFHGLVEKMAPRFRWTDAAFRRLAESDADLIHIHNFHGDYATVESLAHVAARKKVLWTFHALWGVTGGCDHPRECRGYLGECGDCPQVGWWPVGPVDRTATELGKKIECLSGAPIRIVAPSLWIANIISGSRVGRHWPVHHIANGTDPDFFTSRKKSGAGEITILVVNRNFSDGQKGFEMALTALNRISSADRIRVILAGENGDIAAGRISSKLEVTVMGFVRDRKQLSELYSGADIFLFASPAENFPCVVLEAMAAECCVVATPCGGVVEQIEHGKSGLLAGNVDGESLATALQEAVSNRELRVRLGKAARQRVSTHFPEKKMIDAHLNLYSEVIDEN